MNQVGGDDTLCKPVNIFIFLSLNVNCKNIIIKRLAFICISFTFVLCRTQAQELNDFISDKRRLVREDSFKVGISIWSNASLCITLFVNI